MIYNKLVLALALSAGLFDGALAQRNGGARQGGGNGGNKGQGGNGGAQSGVAQATGAASSAAGGTAAASGTAAAVSGIGTATPQDLQLNPANVQVGSQSDGQANAEAGQSPSETDPANFINFCTGKTTTNGLQVKQGSCNGIVMGDMPSNADMISTIITNPGPGDDIQANTDFTITLQVNNLVAGTFTNPDNTYYAAPQFLKGGKVVGHSHVTVQDIGTLDTANPPNPAEFQFFKGINDAGDGNGGLSAAVPGGLPAGTYRVCSMNSAANHQPVLMPVAQRGAQDDCQKFTVGAGNGGNGGNNGNGGNAAANNTGNAAASTTEAAAATSSTAAAAGGNGGNGGRQGGGQGGRGRGRGRFVMREYVA